MRRPARALVLGLALTATIPLHAQTPAPGVAPAGTTRWVVDPVHSQVDFRVRHMVGRVRGTFRDWYGVLTTRDTDWTTGTVDVSVQTRSLDTGNAYRDADLRSNRFFATDSFPGLTFKSTAIHTQDSTVQVQGILTIKGHAHPVTLTGQYLGIARDADGHERIGFDAGTTVDRRDYGIDWNETVGGTNLIGNEVEISIAIEAVRVN
jgi:polyisoprenoid-binding protein YceI